MESLTRRGFITTFGAAALGVGATTMLAGCSQPAKADDTVEPAPAPEPSAPAPALSDFVSGGGSYAEGALDLGWAGTPDAISVVGNSTMPLAELNRRRRAYLAEQTEYTMEDGTVVPVGYVRMRALFNTYGMGCGNFPSDSSLINMINDMTEEQAQFVVDCPLGVSFSVYEASLATGHPVETCEEWLDRMVYLGYMKRYRDDSGLKYCHMGYFQGAVETLEWRHFAPEFRDTDASYLAEPGLTGSSSAEGEPWIYDLVVGGSHQFRSVPCFEDVVGDGKILGMDDVREVLKTRDYVGISPCVCRMRAAEKSGDETLPKWEEFLDGSKNDYFSEPINTRIETCISMGAEAQNWIEKGFARKATVEEALELLERNMDDGFICNAMANTECETICSCRGDFGCGILNVWSVFGDDLPNSPMGKQCSHYNLEVDLDSCIGCGTCVLRCPLQAVTMDESGKPVVAGKCLKCGQCAHTCPAGARKLNARDESENYVLPLNMIEDNNMKAAWRFEHGYIHM